MGRRNGHRQRPFDGWVGTLDLGMPKLLSGSCFPAWCPLVTIAPAPSELRILPGRSAPAP
jgi:hypothetical protein